MRLFLTFVPCRMNFNSLISLAISTLTYLFQLHLFLNLEDASRKNSKILLQPLQLLLSETVFIKANGRLYRNHTECKSNLHCRNLPYFFKKQEIPIVIQLIYNISYVRIDDALIRPVEGFCFKTCNKGEMEFLIPIGKVDITSTQKSIILRNTTIGIIKIKDKLIPYGHGTYKQCRTTFRYVLSATHDRTLFYSQTASNLTYSFIDILSPINTNLNRKVTTILSALEFLAPSRSVIWNRNIEINTYKGKFCMTFPQADSFNGYGELMISNMGKRWMLHLSILTSLDKVVNWMFPGVMLFLGTLENLLESFDVKKVRKIVFFGLSSPFRFQKVCVNYLIYTLHMIGLLKALVCYCAKKLT